MQITFCREMNPQINYPFAFSKWTKILITVDETEELGESLGAKQ